MPTFTRAIAGLTVLLLVTSSLAACGSDDPSEDGAEGGAETTADDATTDSSADGATSTTADPSTSSTTPPTEPALDGEATEEAIAVVDRFLAALADGDAEAAWEVVDERSREAIGGFDAFAAMGTELAEGYGAWADVEDRQVFVGSAGVVAGSAAWPVTILGEVAQEGPPALAATSVLTRVGPDGITVSPFESPGDALGVVSFDPAEGVELTTEQAVVIGVPEGLTTLLVAVDDEPVSPEELRQPDADGATTMLAVMGLGEPGPHAVTVVVSDEGGAVAASAAGYLVVEGPSGDDGDAGGDGVATDPESLARSVFEAWQAGALTSVKDVTTLDVQAALSARPPADDDAWSSDPICEGAAGSTYCVWDGSGEQLIIRVSNVALGDGSGPPVVEARFEPLA